MATKSADHTTDDVERDAKVTEENTGASEPSTGGLPEGPVVVHFNNTTDDHSWVTFGSGQEAFEFENQLKSNRPMYFEFETHLLTDAQEILDAFPSQEPQPEPTPQQTEAQRSKEERPSAGIPDTGTLNAMSRGDLDAIADDNGLNPDDYANKPEIVQALVEKRDS